MCCSMGKAGESTLRIDEPLHFMFLVAYLITYFCCAYLLFVCFKNCKRLLRRKANRPSSSRVINVAEVLNNFHSRQRLLRQMQVNVNESGMVSSELCDGNDDGEGDNVQNNSLQESSSSLNNNDRSLHTNCSSRLNNDNNSLLMITPTRGQRIYSTRCLNYNYSPIMHISNATTNSTLLDDGTTTSQMSDLPTYDVSISEDDLDEEEVEESPPPSYTECVLEQPNSRTSRHRVIVMDDNNTIIYQPKDDERESSTTQQNTSLVKIIVIEKSQDEE